PRPLGPDVGRLALERLARRRRGRVRRPALLPRRHSADRSDGEAAGSGRCALMRTAREAAIFVTRGGQFLLMHRAQDDYWHVAAGVVEEGESSQTPPPASCAKRPDSTCRSPISRCPRATACLKGC